MEVPCKTSESLASHSLKSKTVAREKNDLDLLVDRVNSDSKVKGSKAMTERELVTHVVKELPSKYNVAIILLKPRTIDELRAACRKAESDSWFSGNKLLDKY